MANMNVFNGSAFTTASLTGMVSNVPYVPSFLGSLNLFDVVPIRTRYAFVDRANRGLKLIPMSAYGAPPDVLDGETRDAVVMETVHLAKRFRLYAHEVDSIRAFGSETEIGAVQAEYMRRVTAIRSDMEATHEFHRLGAVQGILLDADGVTVIYDFYEQFGIAKPASVTVALSNADTDLRAAFSAVVRSITAAGGGAITPATRIHALAGDEFFDALVSHKRVEQTYLNYQAAAELRGAGAYGSLDFGGIVWHNYRGTDDGSTVAIKSDEAKLFPVGARDVFKVAYSPIPTADFVGTPGQPIYMMNIRDEQRNMWVQGEIYSNPLYVCQRPDLLRTMVLA